MSSTFSEKLNNGFGSIKLFGIRLFETYRKAVFLVFGIMLVLYLVFAEKDSIYDICQLLEELTDIGWYSNEDSISTWSDILSIFGFSIILGFAYSIGKHFKIFYAAYALFKWVFGLHIAIRIFVIFFIITRIGPISLYLYNQGILSQQAFSVISSYFILFMIGSAFLVVGAFFVWGFKRDSSTYVSSSDDDTKPHPSEWDPLYHMRNEPCPHSQKIDMEIQAEIKRQINREY